MELPSGVVVGRVGRVGTSTWQRSDLPGPYARVVIASCLATRCISVVVSIVSVASSVAVFVFAPVVDLD